MEYGIVIGIDHYEKRPLGGAVADAQAFANFLTEHKLISKPEKNLKVLKSESANQQVLGPEIDQAIEDFSKEARKIKEEKNRLYFYFSGHGIGNTFDNTALCLRLWPDLINHCISSLNYKTGMINKGAFDEILIFLDCCREHDNTIKGNNPLGDWETKVGERNPKVLICNSTIYGKLSYEVSINPDEKRGAFTSFLIDSLKGDADIRNAGKITALDLKQHIKDNFPGYAQKFNKIQEGNADTQSGGDDIVICEVQKLAEDHNFEITFTRNTSVTLIGKNAEPMRTDNVASGEQWRLKLEKGTYVLKDNNSGEQKPIINFSENTMGHEQF